MVQLSFSILISIAKLVLFWYVIRKMLKSITKLFTKFRLWSYSLGFRKYIDFLIKINTLKENYNFVRKGIMSDPYALFFYVTKTVLVGPKWFWSDQIDLDLTLMIWSWPKWNVQEQNEMVKTKMNWSGPNVIHFW